MKILVLGAGGTGGYYGGRLLEAGADVTFLVRPPRAETLRRDGLILRSTRGNAILHPKVMTTEETLSPYDLIFLSCKSYDLTSSMTAIRPAVGSQTVILPVLNGLQHLDVLDQALGAQHVLGGFAQIAVTLKTNGEIEHLNEVDVLGFGPRDSSTLQKQACQTFLTLTQKSTIEARLCPDVIQEMWEKFTYLTSMAGITCLMRGSIGQISSTSYGEQIVLELFDECREIATRSGHSTRPHIAEKQVKILTDKNSTLTASMLRDLEAGTRIEAETIVGDMLRRGLKFNLPLPLLKTVYTHLQTYMSSPSKLT